MRQFLRDPFGRRARRAEEKKRTVSKHLDWFRRDYFIQSKEKHGHVRGIPDLRLFFLQSLLRSIEDVEGDVAECGTRFGKSALFMLDVMVRPRRMFLFDSFEGLSDPTEGKDTLATSFQKNSDKRVFHIDDRQAVFDQFKGKDVEIMQGWIPDRFPEIADRTFAFVHVDVDMYRPTLDSFEFFYERMAPNGIMVCDDYGSSNYPGARDAMDEFFATKPESVIEAPQGQAFIVKRD